MFSRLAISGALHECESARRSVDGKVVKRIELMSQAVLGQTRLARLGRFALVHWLIKMGPIRRQFRATATGLDHSLDWPVQ